MLDELKHFLKHPNWRRQHGWRRGAWQAMNRLGLTGLYGLPMSRRWVDIHRTKMPIVGLDPAHANLKVVQVSDLHHSPVVGPRYLIQFVRWVNELDPDLVVVTGDLITGGYRYADRVGTILSHLRTKLGVICTLGNHDYSMFGKAHAAERDRRGAYLERRLEARGLIVLRNEVHYVGGTGVTRPLAIVGLDDEWTGSIDPAKAWAGVDPTLPIVCLNHNPVNTRELLAYPWQWMLAGHTHGRQLATSRLGKRFNSHRRREFTQGYYPVAAGRHLYVNRGLSYGQRVLDWCRPEVTVFRLVPAEAAAPAAAAGPGGG